MGVLDTYMVGVDGVWSDREAAHLFRRAGFGALPAERAAAVANGDQQSFEAAVDSLVNVVPNDPWLDGPSVNGAGLPGDPFADLPLDEETDLGRLNNAIETGAIAAYWMYRMRYTSQPFQEQFALFLHDHMVSEHNKVSSRVSSRVNQGNDGSDPDNQRCTDGDLAPDTNRKRRITNQLMLNQNALFRQTGLGDFRALLLSITRDPAMLLYLDNDANRKGKPQENFAREVMELFSMGEGNYSEQDIREIAKCFTGETLPFRYCEGGFDYSYGFDPEIHEPGSKNVFGATIQESFSGQETVDVIDLILNKVSVAPVVSNLAPPYNDLPATAVYMAWKLLTWFVKTDLPLDPPHEAVLELAHYLRGTDNAPYPARQTPYDLRAAVRKIFTSKFFYSQENYFNMYKNPVDFVVFTLRMLEIYDEMTRYGGPVGSASRMGMELFEPPDVGGWIHGSKWITTGSTVEAFNYANRVAHTVLGASNGGDEYITALPFTDPNDHAAIIEYFRDRLIQDELTVEEEAKLHTFLEGVPGSGDSQYLRKIRGIIHVMLCMPILQLK